ncbi:hypothetical protein DLE60_34245 [Micromonospora globispora]|uniref:Acetoacetate decarboxylase n=1 Tax=Micromonospora globispora TaxID=1450148 RepID=A0A317JW02_9ACTN|nr:hypothetical protein [Micromonospora globispora]PWU44947.1 hypothetical protein DLJ46_23410 [Micromonospora globispora]PWU48516.1 hypothetical protein DLE60_34245 [Micromonospora globispora]RQX05243.1 hypothetical protein DKL51_02595 [Micromonospora globispora]
MLDSAAPQLVVNARLLLFSWLPADPDAVAALVPDGLRPRPDRQVFLCQYVVDDESQTSGFGAYSLTYLGVSLVGMDPPEGDVPGGWWTHYLASSPRVREYAAVRGVPVSAGQTSVNVRGEQLTAETRVDGRPLIRTVARVGDTGHVIRSGHHRYVTARDGELISADYPYVAEPVAPFEIESVEFLVPEHPVYPLRPANPLTIGWGFYSPRVSFAYPAGPHALDGTPVAEPA